MPAIVVANLSKTFRVKEKAAGLRASLRSLWRPRTSEVRAVRGVDFEVEAGGRVAFIGPNGAGKSTTIKMLVGILYPTTGT
ncbi:MAG TPA: ATP-binding cassette domain-containing protein, partial [Anaerolineae bacterium]|nr:ATP-binding cassette domain-containing protein [Anaerolineae bacterium]